MHFAGTDFVFWLDATDEDSELSEEGATTSKGESAPVRMGLHSNPARRDEIIYARPLRSYYLPVTGERAGSLK